MFLVDVAVAVFVFIRLIVAFITIEIPMPISLTPVCPKLFLPSSHFLSNACQELSVAPPIPIPLHPTGDVAGDTKIFFLVLPDKKFWGFFVRDV